MKKLRSELKKCQPYYIERELLPLMYFKEDTEETEYWIFYYAFIRRLSDLSIRVRLGYTRQHILRLTNKIIEKNHDAIFNFVDKMLQKSVK